MRQPAETLTGFTGLARVDFSQPELARADTTGHMPRKTIRLSERELERWQRAAELAGVSLSEPITAATVARVEQLECDHVADLELDRYVRDEVDAAIRARSAVTCSCEECTDRRLSGEVGLHRS